MGTKRIERVAVTLAFVVAASVALAADLTVTAHAGAPAAGWTRVEDGSSDVTQIGAWTLRSSVEASAGAYSVSGVAGDLASFTFQGTAIRVVGPKTPSSGITAVTLDGVSVGTFDAYAASARHQRVLFERSGLPGGTHTIALAVTGLRHRRARKAKTMVDAFDFTDASKSNADGLTDGFETFGPNEAWAQGSTHGGWNVRYTGYGSVGTAVDDSIVHRQAPKASTSAGETHASLVTSTKRFSDFTASIRTKTVRQLRSPTPNPWETAWVLWDWEDDEHFYYFIAKPNGWELGKVDDTRRDPNGPECSWPEYRNCLYEGAQVYLATDSAPKFPVGNWYEIGVTKSGATMTITVDGQEVIAYTDTTRPYTGGSFGLYNEDASVVFDDVNIAPGS